MTIEEYADVINVQIEITYYPNQENRWSAKFKGGEIQEASMLSSVFGNGNNPHYAIDDYLNKIKLKTLVFDAMSTTRRREYIVPNSITFHMDYNNC